jgi:hypothetical protein
MLRTQLQGLHHGTCGDRVLVFRALLRHFDLQIHNNNSQTCFVSHSSSSLVLLSVSTMACDSLLLTVVISSRQCSFDNRQRGGAGPPHGAAIITDNCQHLARTYMVKYKKRMLSNRHLYVVCSVPIAFGYGKPRPFHLCSSAKMSPALVESFPTILPASAPSAIDLPKHMPIQNEEKYAPYMQARQGTRFRGNRHGIHTSNRLPVRGWLGHGLVDWFASVGIVCDSRC